MLRYADSKLANVYFAAELDKRFRTERGAQNIYCNSCHPGAVTTTGLGGTQTAIPQVVEKLVRWSSNFIANTVADAAKTQTVLAASKRVVEEDVHGEYWAPTWSWTQVYKGTGKGSMSALMKDEDEWRKLWEFSEGAVRKAMGTV